MAYRLKDYLYNDKFTKEQNILMDRLYKLRMSGMAEAFEKQLLEPNTGLEPFEVRFAAIVNQEWDQRERTLKNRFCPCLYYNAVLGHVKQDWLCQPCLACILLITFPLVLRRKFPAENGSGPTPDGVPSIS